MPDAWAALGSDGSVLVRTAIANDSIDEGAHAFDLQARSFGGQGVNGTATIDDHGGGLVFLAGNITGVPNVAGDAGYPRLDDDRPRELPPVLPTPAPVVEAPVPAPVPEVPPPAAAAPAPASFDSALVVAPAALPGDMRTLTPSFEASSEVRSMIERSSDLGDIYTRSSGFRTMVTPSPEPMLQTFRGVEDQVIPASRQLNVQVPADAFVHTDANETVQLIATQLDGRALPAWLHFDGKAGTFSGEPPQGVEIDLRLKVVARDTKGREAVSIFRVKSGEQSTGWPRPGLSSQLMRGEALARTMQGREWSATRQPVPART